MKKFFLGMLFLISTTFAAFSQTLSGPSGAVASGTTITIKAVGETLTNYLYGYMTFNSSATTTASPYSGEFGNIQATPGTVVVYNGYTVPPTPSSIQLTVINHFSQPLTATFHFTVGVYNNGSVTYFQDKTCTVTINPVPVFYNQNSPTGTFTRNNCGGDFQGSSVSYTIQPGTIQGTSQANADANATAALSSLGQAYANSHGTCTQVTWHNTAYSAGFTKNDCSSGLYGSTVYYNVPANKYTSSISQADADSKAEAEALANGQANANANGTCDVYGTLSTIVATYYSNPSDSTSFYLLLNGANLSGPRTTAVAGQSTTVAEWAPVNTNTTLVLQVTSGHMPTSASIAGFWGHINGVISGNTITFSGINFYMTQSINMSLY